MPLCFTSNMMSHIYCILLMLVPNPLSARRDQRIMKDDCVSILSHQNKFCNVSGTSTCLLCHQSCRAFSTPPTRSPSPCQDIEPVGSHEGDEALQFPSSWSIHAQVASRACQSMLAYSVMPAKLIQLPDAVMDHET